MRFHQSRGQDRSSACSTTGKGQAVPIRREHRRFYRSLWWRVLSRDCRARAGHRCEGCGAVDRQPHPVGGWLVVLAACHVHHDRENPSPELRCWCQGCHLRHDGRQYAIGAAKTMRRRKAVADLFGG